MIFFTLCSWRTIKRIVIKFVEKCVFKIRFGEYQLIKLVSKRIQVKRSHYFFSIGHCSFNLNTKEASVWCALDQKAVSVILNKLNDDGLHILKRTLGFPDANGANKDDV